MKKNIGKMVLAFCVAIAVMSTAQAEDKDLPAESKQAMANFLKADPSLKTFVQNSAGHAIFPTIGKGGFIVGGAHGKGLVFEKGKVIGEATVTQASVGAQAGGQTFSELIVFENAQALNDFKASTLQMSADISAVAAAEGASKAARYQQGVAVFALPKKGLMVEASVGGQKFKFDPLQ